jgi:hypothetical protein
MIQRSASVKGEHMAYLNFLVAASEQQVQALRKDSTVLLRPSLVVAVSHLIAYWVEIQPLGELLSQALDGGERVNDQLWHPLREPAFHAPGQVRVLHRGLTKAWGEAGGPQTERDDWDWYRHEIGQVLRAFGHASERGECIVSVLAPPADAERAGRVRMPFASPGEEAEAGAPPAIDRAGSWPVWSIVGVGAGGIVLGALGLCYWRYRRTWHRGKPPMRLTVLRASAVPPA